MVKRILKTAVVASLVGLVPMASARAVTNQTVCGGTTLQFCVNFVVAATATPNQYTLTVTYVSALGAPSGAITSFGIDGSGIVANAVSVSAPGSSFVLGNCNDLNDEACASATPPPVGPNGIQVGESGVLTFTAVGWDGQLDSDVFANAHIQGYGQQSCSIKVGTGASEYTTTANSGGGSTPGSYQAGNFSSVDQCGGTTVPEPASIFLVGTGLAGLGGLIRRRRRAA